MKRNLLVAGLLVTSLSVFLGEARSGPRGGFPGRGFGGAFRAGAFGRRGPTAFVGQRTRFSSRGRFFLRRRGYPAFSVLDLGAFGFPALFPGDGYLYDYPPVTDYGMASIDPQSNSVPAVVQAAPVQGGYYPAPVYVMINTAGNTSPAVPIAAGPAGAGGYGPAASALQQTKPVQEPDEPAVPSRDRPRPVPSPGPATPAGTFASLALVSWFNENGKNTVLVENTATNEIRQITSEPDKDNLRIVEIHPSLNPKLSEVVISNGTDRRTIRFRSEAAQ